MRRSALGRPGVLGKHPTRGDFLAAGNRDAEFTEFDAFLTRNIEWAEAHGSPSFRQAYDAGTVQAFAYQPTSGSRVSALVGAFAPSCDRAGRRFPLTVAMPLRAHASLLESPELLPLALESCWLATSERVLGFTMNADALVDVGQSPLGDSSVALDDALEGYSSWTRTLPVLDLWELMFGPGGSADPVRVLHHVCVLVATCRGAGRSESNLALRLPLGAAGGAALCFWLDWVSRIARWRQSIPSFFWSHNGQDGAVIIALGRPPSCTLAELWQPTGSRDQILDIAVAPWQLPVVPANSPVAEALARLPTTCSVAELIHAAHTMDL